MTSGSSVVAVAREHKVGVGLFTVFVLLLIAAAAYGAYSFWSHSRPIPFANFTVTQVTNTGNAGPTSISPDGKYILTVHKENGQQSLWLHNVASGSDTQVVKPTGQSFISPAFSPDGNYIYFRETLMGATGAYNLYRAPVLGGSPEVLSRDVDTNASFSPDGKFIAFIRANDPVIGQWNLLQAAADGTNEKVLATESVEKIRQWVA